MEPKGLLPCSEEFATRTYAEPVECSPPSHTVYLRDRFILASHLRLGLPSDLYPSGFPTEFVTHF